jgi:hypothetical protein
VEDHWGHLCGREKGITLDRFADAIHRKEARRTSIPEPSSFSRC